MFTDSFQNSVMTYVFSSLYLLCCKSITFLLRCGWFSYDRSFIKKIACIGVLAISIVRLFGNGATAMDDEIMPEMNKSNIPSRRSISI